LRKACEIESIPNKCRRNLPARQLVLPTHLALALPRAFKEAKMITLQEPTKDPKIPRNLRVSSLLSTTGKLFGKFMLKLVQSHIEEGGLLNGSQRAFRVCDTTKLHFMRLRDHVTLNFKNNICTAAVFMDIEKVFDTIWLAI
jgi:hypothetical protein